MVESVNFRANVKNETQIGKKETPKTVYVSKNPSAVVNATGVVAGTAGMVGGAVLGGTVGLCKLPGELISTIAGQNYSQVIKDSAEGFKTAIKNNPGVSTFIGAINNIKSPEVAEEFIEITRTMSSRLHETFKNDVVVSSVLDDVVDPFIKSLSVKENFRSYTSAGVKQTVKSPVGQTILKFLGLNKKTSKIIGDITGNVAEGISQAAINIQNFTPEQKEAWKKVCDEMIIELEKNPKIKTSTGLVKGLKEMLKDSSWITEPLKGMQDSIVSGAKELNNGLGKVPLKTIGKFSLIGAAICGTLSTLGWGLFKGALMEKETKKSELVL